MAVEERLRSLGLELPQPPKPVGNYRPAKHVGNLVFTSGQTARLNGIRRYVGKVGMVVTDDDAYLSARDAALNCLACVKWAVGSLDRVKSIVKLTGFVNCVDGYQKQPNVINGASDLLEKLFGDAGAHARSAIGVNSLPSDVSVELEMVVEIE
jgi:enamine deaminase RidA (YjgF/YER057c/UK114 family)